jgi:hypothetical protein
MLDAHARHDGALYLGALCALLSLAPLTGCGDKDTEKEREADAGAALEIEADEADPDAPRVYTAADVSPKVGVYAPPGRAPQRVVFDSLVDLVESRRDAVDPDADVFSIEPPVAGRLVRATDSRLEFVPREPFTPGQEYTASFDSVGVQKQKIDAPAVKKEKWSVTFEAPPFKVVGMGAPIKISPTQVEVELVFSARPRIPELSSFVQWRYGGESLEVARYERATSPEVVRATLTSKAFEGAGKNLTVSVAAGLEWGDGVKAPAFTSSARVEEAPELEIATAFHAEGGSGYYIDVICDDDAVAGGKRYYWDRQNYDSYYVSARCVPTEESARRHIELEPPVEFSVSPSGAGFRIFGDFKRGDYSLRFASGLRTEDGGVLRRSYERRVVIPSRAPSLELSGRARYMPRAGFEQVALKHLNAPEVEVTARHIPRANLMFWLSGDDERASARVSDVVARRTLDLRAEEDVEGTEWLELSGLLPGDQKGGVYEIAVEGAGKRDAMRLLRTDLNLVVKREAQGPKDAWSRTLHVWAFGMTDLKPRRGVDIELVRPSGSTMATCTTDKSGGCTLSVPPKRLDDTPPMAVLATTRDDFTYLKFDDVPTSINGPTSARLSYLTEQAYSATVYADRDLYRPGETAHFVGVLRERDFAAPDDALPVELVVTDARGRVAKRRVVKTNPAGLVSLDLPLPDFATTGRWSLALVVGKRELTRYGFGVEEFVPERMEVRVDTLAEAYLTRDDVEVDVQARYLFGGSAKGSNAELRCRVEPTSFSPEKNAEYAYGAVSELGGQGSVDLGITDTLVLSDQGPNTLKCPLMKQAGSFRGHGDVVATVSVTEAGSGRVTTRTTRAPVHPARHAVGLKTDAREAQPGRELTVEGVVVDWSGQILDGAVDSVDLEVVRMVSEYGWYYDPVSTSESYRWYRRPVREQTLSVPVSKGRFTAKITPRQAGEAIVVRAVAGGASADLEIAGSRPRYYWSSGRDSDATPRPGAPGTVTFDAPATAQVGAPIEVTFESPYDGRALVALETHAVLEHTWMDVKAGANSFTFTAKEFTPNVYASAMVFKDPHLESKDSFLPARATGAASIQLAPETFTHDVTIAVADEVRSESTLDVSVQVSGDTAGSFATVAVIDEGILGLTKFKTPDPNEDIFARRALDVDAFDTFGWAFRRESAVGGDADYDDDGSADAGLGRRQSIKPVAIWTGPVEVPKSGKLDLSFDLPLYRGKLRVMAVVAGPKRIGSADANVIVRDPINLQATLPRFMSGGDVTQVPVFVTNSSGAERAIAVSFEAFEDVEQGASVPPQAGEVVRVLGPASKTVTLADGDSASVVFTVEALRQSGAARFAVAAVAGDLSSRAEAMVPFIPSGPRERVLKTIEVAPGRVDLAAQLTGWVPTSETTTFWLTTNPYGQAFDHLTYLIRYPYGCIEQTTSSTRPLLFIGDLVAQVMPELAATGELEKMIDHGVRRVLSMQTSSGGFAYWPGSDTPDVWGTAYASHMLLDAIDAGHDVSRERVDAALDWLADNVGDSEYQYAEAYVHYVLARSGRGKKARVRALQAALPRNPTGRAAEDAFLLMAALHEMGDHRFEEQLKSPDLSQPERNSRYGYSYYSDLRRRGLALSVFQDLFGKDPAGEKLARQVGQLLSKQRSSYYTTQELVWGITGLGKWVDAGAASFDASLTRGAAGDLKPASSRGAAKTWRLHRASEYPELALDVKAKGPGKLYLVISSEGVRERPSIGVGGKGLAITRNYYDVNGERMDGSEVALGDLIFAEVVLENRSGSRVENLALVERFPAGWEVENPNLGRGALPGALEDMDTWGLDHMNVRDDRVEAFGTLGAGESGRVFVALRATSAGTFLTPSATAEGMYEPELWARAADRKIRVVGPWERGEAGQ